LAHVAGTTLPVALTTGTKRASPVVAGVGVGAVEVPPQPVTIKLSRTISPINLKLWYLDEVIAALQKCGGYLYRTAVFD